MNPFDDRQQSPPGGMPEDPGTPPGYGPGHGYGPPPGYGYGPGPGANGYPPPSRNRKSKWVSALFSLLFPGAGHMYVGLMGRGIAIMLLLALNICAIVFFGVEYGGGTGSVLIIVLLSLLVPILYLYSLFDVLQQTDSLNERYAAGWRPGMERWHDAPPAPGQAGSRRQQQVPVAGVVLLAAGGVALFSMADTDWTRWLLHSSGSMIGAVILIVIGGLLWLWEKRGHTDERD